MKYEFFDVIVADHTMLSGQRRLLRTESVLEAAERARTFAAVNQVTVSIVGGVISARPHSATVYPDGRISGIYNIAESTPFRPERGKIYQNGTSRFLCTGQSGFDASMINVKTGWAIKAMGCRRYFDGSIEWDHSINGHFETPPEIDAKGEKREHV